VHGIESAKVKPTPETAISFVPIAGRWSVQPDHVTYVGPQEGDGVPVGICVTSVGLADGTVTVRVQGGGGGESGRILLGYRSQGERYVMIGLGGHGFAYTIAELRPGIGWQALAYAGSGQSLMPDHWYGVRAETAGLGVRLFVDNVRVLEHVLKEQLVPGQVGLFAWGEASVRFAGLGITARPQTVFVVMQFSDQYSRVFGEIIRPVAAAFGLRAYHAGEIFGPGMILKDIVQGIADARVVVADITPANQNVFYELGYAHALGKPVILLAELGKDLPFDLRGYRVLFYETGDAGLRALEDGLRRHFEAIVHE